MPSRYDFRRAAGCRQGKFSVERLRPPTCKANPEHRGDRVDAIQEGDCFIQRRFVWRCPSEGLALSLCAVGRPTTLPCLAVDVLKGCRLLRGNVASLEKTGMEVEAPVPDVGIPCRPEPGHLLRARRSTFDLIYSQRCSSSSQK
jgi:hypothetical protein